MEFGLLTVKRRPGYTDGEAQIVNGLVGSVEDDSADPRAVPGGKEAWQQWTHLQFLGGDDIIDCFAHAGICRDRFGRQPPGGQVIGQVNAKGNFALVITEKISTPEGDVGKLFTHIQQ